MTLIEKIISDNFSNYKELSMSENFITYKSNFNINDSSLGEESFIEKISKIHSSLFDEFNQKFEYARLICKIGLNNPISISLIQSELSAENLSDIKDSFLNFDEEADDFYLEFDISKQNSKVNYILSLKCFFDYLYLLTYEGALIKWSFLSYASPVSFFFGRNALIFHPKQSIFII